MKTKDIEFNSDDLVGCAESFAHHLTGNAHAMNLRISHLLDITRTMRTYERALAVSGESFNIFEILNIGTLEVVTHSPMLAELLSPQGRHGLGSRCLRCFLSRFELRLDAEKTKVREEHYIGQLTDISGGRIDIFLSDGVNQVIIENKIYAGDQHNQLARYRNDFPDAQIIYLTLDGRGPPGNSDPRSMHVHCRSYANDVLGWLEDCRQEATCTPLVRETIAQYIALIRRLTDQSSNSRMSTQIAKLALNNEESLAAYFELLTSKSAVIEAVVARLREQAEAIAADFNLQLEFGSDHLRGRYSGFSFSDASMEASNVRLQFQFQAQDHRVLNFGISLRELGHSELAPPTIAQRFREVFGQCREVPWWPAVANWRERSDWTADTYAAICFGDFKEELRDKVAKLAVVVRTALNDSRAAAPRSDAQP
jgi:hypothetical protein